MKKFYDVIIIGGGPSGYTAGIYTSRALLNTLIVTSLTQPSQVVFSDYIENYPGFPDGINGFDFVERLKQQVIKFNCEILTDDVVKINPGEGRFDIYLSSEKTIYESKCVIIATGRRSKKLGLPKEETFVGRGISYCAVCDAFLYKDKTVAVIGGGDTAFTEAIFISKFVKKLYVIHRRKDFRATKILQKRLFEKNNVEVLTPYIVEELLGEDMLSGIVIKNVETSEVKKIICDGVFVCIGHQPNTEFVNKVLQTDDEGYIITDNNLQSSVKGIFACGDCRSGSVKQIVSACADGAKAALSVINFCNFIS
ncbi:MAG: thioredoxin-disulfide reductase [Endomicrobia bacterium]|nr:thioredoxin-disulfide reductase [Endomicrobiia bacterium]